MKSIFFIKELSIVSDIMSTMENRIINIFGGKALDHWSVVCKLYKPPPKMPVELIKNSGRGESMYLLSFSSKPNHVYSIIDEKIVMEADNAFVELIAKIKNIWVQRQMAKIDVRKKNKIYLYVNFYIYLNILLIIKSFIM